MKKIITFFAIAMLLASSLISLAACNGDDSNADKFDGEIWSSPATVKVARDDIDYENKGPAEITLDVVKNEYESYQLYITPKKDVSSFYLASADLSDGKGHTIAKSNITVYYQKYIAALNEKIPYRSAWYPDALIPMENADKAGENVIRANENGAMWITFYIPKDAEAGIYTADFTLKINKENYRIPVTVNVYDYTLTDEINQMSSLTFRPMYMAPGELDSSYEMREKHYEFFLDYRLALRFVPIETASAQERVEGAIKYFDRTPCFGIYAEDILPLAEASTPEMNLLSKAIVQIIDEGYMFWSGGYPEVLARHKNILRNLKEQLQSAVNTIASDTTGKYDSFKQIENWQDYILNIINVVPDHFNRMLIRGDQNDEYIQEYLEMFNGWCTLWNTYDDQLREQYLDLTEEYDAHKWWYSTLAPTAPYATYHIADTNLLSARTISWLGVKYDIEGTVYWGTVHSAIETNTRWAGARNIISNHPFDGIYRIGDVDFDEFPAGDGLLAYPGAAYGVYGPIPSTRIMSIRDGFEEYEMLLDLENKYQELVDAYADEGLDIDVEALMDEFYNKVYYNGVQFYADGERGLDFSVLRKTLLETLANINDPCQFMMQSKVVPIQNKAELTLYANGDYDVKVNGTELSPVQGSQVKYEYDLDLNEKTSVIVEVKNRETGETFNYSRFISLPFKPLMDFDTINEVPQTIKVTDTSSVEINENPLFADMGKSMKFTIKSVFTGEIKDAIFTPYLKIPVSLFQEDVNFSDVSSLSFFVYNPGEEYVVMIKLYSGSSYALCGQYIVAPGKNKIVLSIDGITYSKLNQIDSIVIEFENKGTQADPTQYVAYLDSMYADMK